MARNDNIMLVSIVLGSLNVRKSGNLRLLKK